MEQCPVCKEPMPALSKICPVCGYIATQADNTNNLLDTLVSNMDKCLHDMKQISKPTIMSGIRNNLFILYMILTIQFFVLAAVSMSTLAWLIVIFFLILSIFATKKRFGKGKNDAASQLKQITTDYESYQRQANTYFGKNKEVRELSQTLTQELETIRKDWQKQTSRCNMAGLIVIIGIMLVTGCAILSLSKFIATSTPPEEEEDFITEYFDRREDACA